jgi:hypothetical protein
MDDHERSVARRWVPATFYLSLFPDSAVLKCTLRMMPCGVGTDDECAIHDGVLGPMLFRHSGVWESYAADIRAGRHRPHPRQALAELVHVSADLLPDKRHLGSSL